MGYCAFGFRQHYYNPNKVSKYVNSVVMHCIGPLCPISRYSNLLSSEGKNGDVHLFRHPFLQTWGLSVGEFSCIIISLALKAWKSKKETPDQDTNNEGWSFIIIYSDETDFIQFYFRNTCPAKFIFIISMTTCFFKEKPQFNPFIFLPAAIFHQSSRCLIFLSLTFTSASSYQMLSGSNLIFTCIWGRIFLKKPLPWHKWMGVTVITSKKIFRLSSNK